MGGRSSKAEAEEQPKELVYDSRKIFYDHDGNLRYGAQTAANWPLPAAADAR